MRLATETRRHGEKAKGKRKKEKGEWDHALTFAFCLFTFAFIVVGAGPAIGGTAREALFPKPPGLAAAVEFWKTIYTRYSTRQALIHDSRDLSVIYEVIDLSSDHWRESKPAAMAAVERYKRALSRLASGPIDTAALRGEGRRAWETWGGSLDPEVYRQAAETVRAQWCQREHFRQGLLQGTPYMERIKAILRRHGVPEELAVLPHVESGFDTTVRSYKGAAGIWQLSRDMGRRYLPRRRGRDLRYDPIQSTVAAAQILKHNYERLGNWPLAITAYNHGLNGIRRAKTEVGSDDLMTILANYKGPLFGFASRNFYAEFLAALEIVEHVGEYFPDLEVGTGEGR